MSNIKSLYDISWKVTEEEYRADSAYSYSTISRYNKDGFDNLDKLFDKVSSPSLTFGSVVDTLLTGGQEEFDRLFFVTDFPNISDTLINITKYLFDTYSSTYRNISLIPDNILAEVGLRFNYYTAPKFQAYRVKMIKEFCEEYYNLLYLSVNKVLISNDDYQDALDCIDRLKNNPYTKFYFESNNPFDRNVERFYQLKFKGEYEGINLRCMSDLLVVNHKDKTITPIDLKTSFKPEWRFYKSFIEYGYWIQANLYWYIIRQNLDKDEVYKDYTLLDYRFIVISRNTKKPLVWEYNDTKVITDLTYGDNNQYKCRNWRNIVKELDYYIRNTPELPLNIKEINNITYWLNNYVGS